MTRTTKSLRVALFVGVFTSLSGASQAADLGGDCCSDLEARVAELEAATASKGNRKVSLTISGYAAQELTWWDDGARSDAYLHGLGPTQATHVKFTGEAQIMPGWKAVGGLMNF